MWDVEWLRWYLDHFINLYGCSHQTRHFGHCLVFSQEPERLAEVNVRVLGEIHDATSPQFRVKQEFPAGPHRAGGFADFAAVRVETLGESGHTAGDKLEGTAHRLAELEAQTPKKRNNLRNYTYNNNNIYRP